MLILLFLGCRCSPSGADMFLYHRIEEKCRGDYPCQVVLSDVVPGDWDRVVFVSSTTSPTVVERGAGLKLVPMNTVQDTVLFCEGDAVVKVDTKGLAFGTDGKLAYLKDAEMTEGWAMFPRDTEFVVTRIGVGILDLSAAHSHRTATP